VRLAPVITRLQAQVPALRAIYGALEAAVSPSYPVAFVYPLGADAAPSALLGTHDQRIVERFGVELRLTQAAAAATGGPAQDALEDLRDAVQIALAGWQAELGAKPIDYVGGSLLGFEGAIAVWREEFTTERYLRIITP